MIVPGNDTLVAIADGHHDHDSYGSRILAVCWLLEVLSAIIVTLRVYCKLRRSRELWYDDHILIAAWVVQTIDVALITANVSLGLGRHTYDLDPAVLPALGRNGNVSGTLSIIATFLSKTSFGVTLLRLAAAHRYVRWIIWFLLASMNVALGLSAVFIWAQCTPVARNWDVTIEGTCWDISVTTEYGLFSGVYSAFVDFALSFLPWALIWNLQMKRREKIGVVVAMSMGVFAGLGAIAKVVQLHNLASKDFPYHESKIVIWGTVESAVTIMAASVPFLRVLVIEARSSLAARPGAADPGARKEQSDDRIHVILEDHEKLVQPRPTHNPD